MSEENKAMVRCMVEAINAGNVEGTVDELLDRRAARPHGRVHLACGRARPWAWRAWRESQKAKSASPMDAESDAMCPASAISASEPVSRPPTISAIRNVVVRTSTILSARTFPPPSLTPCECPSCECSSWEWPSSCECSPLRCPTSSTVSPGAFLTYTSRRPAGVLAAAVSLAQNAFLSPRILRTSRRIPGAPR